MSDALTLRKLALWFREFAERAGNPTIWDARLRTAENLESEADELEHRLASEGIAPARVKQAKRNDRSKIKLLPR